MTNSVETTAQQDLTKVETAVKTDIATVQTDVKADLAKTYSGKIVLGALVIGIVVGFLLHLL